MAGENLSCQSFPWMTVVLPVIKWNFFGLGLIPFEEHITTQKLTSGNLNCNFFQVKCDFILAYMIKNFQDILMIKFTFTKGKCIISSNCKTFDIPVNLFYFLLKHIVTNNETKWKTCEPIFPQGLLKVHNLLLALTLLARNHCEHPKIWKWVSLSV